MNYWIVTSMQASRFTSDIAQPVTEPTLTGSQTGVQPIANGDQMSVLSPDAGTVEQIVALRFHGLMTIGAHHQHYRLMIA